ncbi:MAG: acetylglutamate kinase [Lentisphaeria bacterium]
MQSVMEKAKTLVEVLPYLQKFRHAVVVIKFGGSTMEDSAVTERVLRDIVLLECIGVKPVIVHGGGKAINAKLQSMGIKPHFINGLRYTCADTIEVVDDVLHNQINADLVKSIRAMGGNSKALSGKTVLKAKKMTSCDRESGEEIDLGFVGEVCDVDSEIILKDLDSKLIPVITPLATDENGCTFNINADIAACKVAEKIHAHKLVFLSDVPGILRNPADESTLISTIHINDVPSLINDGVLSGGMLPKIRSAISALECGVNKVHMIDGRLEHSLLLELLTDSGIGTEIVK